MNSEYSECERIVNLIIKKYIEPSNAEPVKAGRIIENSCLLFFDVFNIDISSFKILYNTLYNSFENRFGIEDTINYLLRYEHDDPDYYDEYENESGVDSREIVRTEFGYDFL